MAGGNTRFQEFLAQEVKKYKGIYVPVKAGLLKRVLVREVPLKKIHPNPDDEFCAPEVGPNNEIVSKYMQVFADPFLFRSLKWYLLCDTMHIVHYSCFCQSHF